MASSRRQETGDFLTVQLQPDNAVAARRSGFSGLTEEQQNMVEVKETQQHEPELLTLTLTYC